MKVSYISDLHLDHSYVHPEDLLKVGETYEVIVVAGDLSSKARGAKFLNELAHVSGARVIFVPGNHDYWGITINKRQFTFKDEELSQNVIVLDQGAVSFGNTIFIGATLWTDFRKDDFIVKHTANQFMNDYQYTKQMYPNHAYGKLKPDTILDIHNKHKKYIFDMIDIFHGEKNIVVVTHHAPSYMSSDPNYTGDLLTHCYCNDFDKDLIDRKITWIHGHIHRIMDYRIGDTRVLCNPRGYGEFLPCLKDFLLD